MINSIDYKGEKEYLYFSLDVWEDTDNHQQFKLFFAYSVLLDKYIRYINKLASGVEYNMVQCEFMIPCKTSVYDDFHGKYEDSENSSMWQATIDIFQTYKNIAVAINSINHDLEDDDYLRRLRVPILPKNMGYTKNYLREKLTEMLKHKKIIINYMLKTFL